MPSAYLIAAAAAFAAPAQSGSVVSGSQLVTAVEACQAVKEDSARLACFDRSVAALKQANARGDLAIVDRNQMRQARRSLFGLSIPKLPFFSGSKDKDVQEEPKELVSTLTGFKDIGNGFFRFSIADPASTWESTEASDVFDQKAGAKVSIHRGGIGNYFVEIGDQKAVRARRIR